MILNTERSRKIAVRIAINSLRILVIVLMLYPVFEYYKYKGKTLTFTDYLSFAYVLYCIPEIVSIIICINGCLFSLSMLFASLLILNKNLLCGVLGCVQLEFGSKLYTKEALFFAVPYVIFTHIYAFYLVIYYMYKILSRSKINQ